MFVKPGHAVQLQAIIRHYALLDSPDEQGAQKNRCNFKEIESEQGSATGYVAKYIAKNIDGYKLETDLTGQPALTASMHVTAWAKTHNIRQFQAFGAGSVMVWRELRRIPVERLQGAPEHIQQAWIAANKKVDIEGETERRADYAGFLHAIGGAALPRKHEAIKLAKQHYGEINRYGELQGEKPVGIYSSDAPAVVYTSTRYTWTRLEGKAIPVNGTAQAQVIFKKTGSGSTWTRVNNCTHGCDAGTQSQPFWMDNLPSKNAIFDRMRC
jgi:hypothetical protein